MFLKGNVPKRTGRKGSKFCKELDRFTEEVQKKHKKKEVEEAAYTQTQQTKARPDAGACLKSQHSEGRTGGSLCSQAALVDIVSLCTARAT